MAQASFSQIVNEVGAALDLDVTPGSDGEDSVKRYVNWAARRVWTSRPWYERRAETVLTLSAPYTTGTVSLTNASTTVTGSGTTFTSGMTGRKIALGYGSPWYRFTYVGATSGTLAQAYAEPSVTGSNYVIFQDEYDVSSTCDVVTAVSILYEGGRTTGLSEARLDDSAYVHSAVGIPRYYSLTDSTTAGTRRLRLWPIPDATYRIRVHYLKSYTDMVGESDLCDLGVNKERLLFKAACLESQHLSDAPPRVSEGELEQLIERVWRDQQDRVPLAYQRRGFDSTARDYGAWLDSTNAFP
jgi:hypothetical protein